MTLLFIALAGAAWFTEEQKITVMPATKTDAVLDPWAADAQSLHDEEEAAPECAWAQADTKYSSPLCSLFAITRFASTIGAQATERAVKCAVARDTDCVLSFEIGLAIPAAFLYDNTEGMRMLVAPRIINGSDERGVRSLDPVGERVGEELVFNYSVTVEYLPGGKRVPVTETLQGMDAYCIQELRRLIVPECWQELE